MAVNNYMQKNWLQVKKCMFATETHPAYFLRPSKEHISPGIKCPESLYMRITDLTIPGAPCYFTHGTQWANIPHGLYPGLSCRADDTANRGGRQFAHGCPYLSRDNRIQSSLRVDSE
eukprot:2005979-Pyramimonas_sp.AAC.2